MKHLKLFNVAPAMPEVLRFLETLAYNMWWSWNLDAIDLFRRIDTQRWRRVDRNPLRLLSSVPQERLRDLADDDSFLTHLEEVKNRFESEVTAENKNLSLGGKTQRLAYFSLEYGIHEMLKVYSGGLGILAGDHLKSASDLGLPLMAVGLLYRQGYFQQHLDEHGWQNERYPETEFEYLPVRRARDSNDNELSVHLPMPDGVLTADVWELDVGRVPLYLMDTNIPRNPPNFRGITGQLYGGDNALRLQQELLLGIGGVRALVALGYDPSTFHVNEGHAAFMVIGRMEYLMKKKGLSRAAAREVISRSTVFTTHTPVPAGNETFPTELVRPHLEALSREIDIDPDEIIADGQAPWSGTQDGLSMTILGLRMAGFANGVSELHGKVARKMWSHLWPGRPESEIPIQHITNGVHVSTWLSPENAALFNRYLGPDWERDPADPELQDRIVNIPDEELWMAHEQARARLVRMAREHIQNQLLSRRANRKEIQEAALVLDQNIFTIGFARRFATYKRATLLLKDLARLEALINDELRPVQIIFAGKAHPADDYGKRLIQEIFEFTRSSKVKGRIVFLENYDMGIARALVQGTDVWLNTPRRPREASGTSGMKAAMNGVLHVSILDGWWYEGYSRQCGWAIGDMEDFHDEGNQDLSDSLSLFNALENEVIPYFYDRPTGDFSNRWTGMMKNSIAMSLGRFASHRMVDEYNERAYKRSEKRYSDLMADGAKVANRLVKERKELDEKWANIRVEEPVADNDMSSLHVGDRFEVTTRVKLGKLSPEDVEVQLYYGPVDPRNAIKQSNMVNMSEIGTEGDTHIFRQQLDCNRTGRHGFTVRVVPKDRNWKDVIPGFIAWPLENEKS